MLGHDKHSSDIVNEGFLVHLLKFVTVLVVKPLGSVPEIQ